MKKIGLTIISFLLMNMILPMVYAQDKPTLITDSNTPLHLLEPDYNIPYGIPEAGSIKNDLDRILAYLEEVTPITLIDRVSGNEIKDFDTIDRNTIISKGDFRLTSYEWGVTYAAMLSAADATGDNRYSDYVFDRFKFLADVIVSNPSKSGISTSTNVMSYMLLFF